MKKLFLVIAVGVICQIGCVSPGLAETSALPNYSGYVNDYAGVLSYENRQALTALIGELERKTTAQIAVVTVDTIAPYDIEGYAVKLFEKWGIGQKGKDNGILLLVAIRERKVRIEVGYGLEGALPDAIAKVIIEDYIVPSFKEGNYNSGIVRGTVGIAKLVAEEYDVTLSEFGTLPTNVPVPRKRSAAAVFFRILFNLFIIILILGTRTGFLWWFLIPGFRRRGGFWYGSGFGGNSGGFGGGFGGFGGGFSGGGGASGGW